MTIDWDAWRAGYDAMDFPTMAAFYDTAYREHPIQQHYDAAAIDDALTDLDPRIVIEYGGWTGDLANAVMPWHPNLERWVNVDICAEAIAHTVGWPGGYEARLADDWPWEPPWSTMGTDVMVASHMIEHLSDHHFERFAATLSRFRGIVLAAPLAEWSQSWDGYLGSHILSYGWHDVEDLLGNHERVGLRGDTRWYRKTS